MKKQKIQKILIIIIIILVIMIPIAGYAVRNFTLWEASCDNLVGARNALDDNLVLLQTVFLLERDSDVTKPWIPAQGIRIKELNIKSDDMTNEIEELQSLSFYNKMFFGERRAQTLRALNTRWHRKKRESIIGIICYLQNRQGR